MKLKKINAYDSDSNYNQVEVTAVINPDMIVSITPCNGGEYYSLALTGAEQLLISASTAKQLFDLSE